MSYPIPEQQAVAEIEIKKSRFIAYARHIVSRETGMAWLEEIKAEYPDARHHCWAYQLGNPHCATNAGMGDDGEPSGTAGKPILKVLQHKGIGDVMIIVVRYFGGIKLGAGGLTRAYGQAAQAVMEILPTMERIPMTELQVTCDFALEQNVRHWLNQSNGELKQVDYRQQVTLTLEIPDSEVETFCTTLRANRCDYGLLEDIT